MGLIINFLKFFKLSMKDKSLFIRAFILEGLFRLIILFIPFRRIASWMGKHMLESPAQISLQMQEKAKRTGRFVLLASKYTPWESKCLVQALTALFLLRRQRIPGTLYLGLAKDGEGRLIAHAWLRCGEVYVTGAPVHHRFKVVARFASESENIL